MFITIFTLVRQHDKNSGTVDPIKINFLEPVQ
jgi:hypothetical protein